MKTMFNSDYILMVLHTAVKVKLFMLAVSSTIVGTVAGELVAFQTPAVQTEVLWYEHPAVIAALVTAIFFILAKLADIIWEKYRQDKQKEDEDDIRHLSVTEKIQELSYQERGDLLESIVAQHNREVASINDLHEREKKFLESQIALKEAGELESRVRSHRLSNELNRVYGYIFMCHNTMMSNGLEIPEFKMNSYMEIMEGVEAEIEKLKTTATSNIRTAIEQINGEVKDDTNISKPTR